MANLMKVLFVIFLYPIFSLGQNPVGAQVVDKDLESIITAGEEIFFYLQPYNYDKDNRRDPFKIYTLLQQDSNSSVAEKEFTEDLPLQQYELSRLKVMGIMWNIKTPRALIADPLGRVHVVVKNDKLGEKKGYIAVIRESEIVVVQSIKKEDGKISYEAKIMNIK